jgi:hypothetical protein
MEVMLQKLPNGCLAPLGEAEQEAFAKYKNGAMIRCTVTQMRNGKFFRKWWLLANYAFDIWRDTMPAMEYKGQQVQPCFERFRKDLTILAGRYHPVFSARGDMRVEADSLKWSEMDEDSFASLYSATIDAVLSKILTNSAFTADQLRNYVDNVMAFDH